jgi:hypothetical protein
MGFCTHGFFALFKAMKAWVQAPKVIKVVKRTIGRKNLHNREIKKENGPKVKKNRCLEGCIH